MNDLKMGVYRHAKGPLYQVIGLAHDSNYEDRECVVYIPLQIDGVHFGPRLAVRSLEDFKERFEYLGAELRGWMLEET